MRILVTGGAGYIGSHTCLALLEQGHEVVVFDNLYNASEEALNRVKKLTGKDLTFYKADMLDRDAMEKIFDAEKIDAVIHFAGLKAVGESVAKPWEYYHNNITGTLILLDVMRKHGVKKIIFRKHRPQIRIHTAPEMFRRIQIRHSRISRIHPRMTGRFRLRILDRIRTGRISRMADRFRLRIRDRIHTGRIHRTAGRFRLSIQGRIHTGRISRTADSSHRRTGSRRIGRISTITDNRPTGRTSRSARDAKRTPSRRSP